MALELNGSTGVSLVQDGVVTAADLASTLDLTGKTVTLPAGVGGKVLQVIDSGAQSSAVNNTTTTFVDGNCTATITPTSASSKIFVFATQDLQVWNTSNYATGRWKIQRNINGGAFSDVYIDYNTSNGNIFAYDYGGSGINIYRPTSYMLLDSPNTTSAIIYKTQIAKGSNGGQLIGANNGSPGRMILMEIAA